MSGPDGNAPPSPITFAMFILDPGAAISERRTSSEGPASEDHCHEQASVRVENV
jgi:hypothetical protein